jgi:HSP20 family protein
MPDTGAKQQKQQTESSSSATPSQSIQRQPAETLGTREYFSPLLSPAEFFSASPFALMRRLAEDIDRTFAGFFEGQGRTAAREGLMWSPRVEVRQTNNMLTVRAELPGLSDKDVQVEATDEGLLIQGERKQEHSGKEGGVQHSEWSYGRFMRLIPLPEGAQVEQAKGEFKNGVLEVNIPVPAQKQQRKQIPISTSGR